MMQRYHKRSQYRNIKIKTNKKLEFVSKIEYVSKMLYIQEPYLAPCQTSKMKIFAKTVNGFLPLTLFIKNFNMVLKRPLY